MTTITGPSSTPVTTSLETSATSGAASPPAINSTQPATSTATSKPTHTAIGVGAGVGVAVGLAILAAGFFYVKHRPSKKRDEDLPTLRAGSNDKGDHRRPTIERKKTLRELPNNETPQELMDPIGHPLDPSELHGKHSLDPSELHGNNEH